jgi:hypothetical protein
MTRLLFAFVNAERASSNRWQRDDHSDRESTRFSLTLRISAHHPDQLPRNIQSSYDADASLNQWIALTPPELVRRT